MNEDFDEVATNSDTFSSATNQPAPPVKSSEDDGGEYYANEDELDRELADEFYGQDDEQYDDEDDDFEDDVVHSPRVKRSRRRKGLFCFNCNRKEGHFLAKQHRWYYSYLVGLTFGLIKFVGPFQCQCCGSNRLMNTNSTNLRFWWRNFSNDVKSSSSRRSR